GQVGDEKDDLGYTFTKPRRYSNSSTHDIRDFKSKYEVQEPEPVFEESIHGASAVSDDQSSSASSEPSREREEL
ncbi:hypothetical protein KEM52_003338, partial [Ascosphaera acerosa]